ncbi:MAG: hypothetical protein GQ474_05290 [Sulfurimonas sp.]|nr:hypothetical protein [Sulfurimonas sp.]
MIKFIIVSIFTIILFNGCSAKEFNEGVDSVTGDISNAIENGRDKSND